MFERRLTVRTHRERLPAPARPAWCWHLGRRSTTFHEPIAMPWPETALGVVAETDCGPVEIYCVHVPNAANGVVKIDSLSAIRCLAAAAPASRILCGDLNTPRRELPDGGVLSFARDSRGRLRLYALPSAGLSVSPRLARERPE